MWQFKALCSPEDSVLMFSELPSKIAKMKSLCAECPVQTRCLEFGMSEEYGIFGGLTPTERKVLADVR